MKPTMRHSYDSGRVSTIHPPISKTGRPTERPHNPSFDRPHRSSSRASRTSTRSNRLYDDGSEKDKGLSEIKKGAFSQAFQRASNKISRKAIKPRPSTLNAETQSRGFDRESFDPIKDKLELSHSDISQDPKILEVQPHQSATKTAVRSNLLPLDRPDKQGIDLSPPNSDMDIIPEIQSTLCETSETIALVPNPHETQATITSGDEAGSDCKSRWEISLDKQRKTINGLKEEREYLSQEVEALNQAITFWKNRTIAAASKSADVPNHMPLSQPESEILKAWQNLAFEVKSFVARHFERVSTNKLASWAKENGEFLREVTPTYQQAVTRNQSRFAMIEAAIWCSLSRLVFASDRGHSPMRWTGDYEKALGSFGEHYR
ncbi:hypothetical protein HG530_001373 [Fusarium avenaceum]|nr:hypothetical protein HG530_001373 [Fusarium avenaceum]